MRHDYAYGGVVMMSLMASQVLITSIGEEARVRSATLLLSSSSSIMIAVSIVRIARLL